MVGGKKIDIQRYLFTIIKILFSQMKWYKEVLLSSICMVRCRTIGVAFLPWAYSYGMVLSNTQYL